MVFFIVVERPVIRHCCLALVEKPGVKGMRPGGLERCIIFLLVGAKVLEIQRTVVPCHGS